MKKTIWEKIREFHIIKARMVFTSGREWPVFLLRVIKRLKALFALALAGTRRRKTGVCLALFLVLQLSTAQNVPVTVEDPFGRAFQATGAELDKLYITGEATLTVEEDENAAAVKIIEKISAGLKISMKDAIFEQQDSSYQKCLKLSFHDENRQTVISVICRREEKRKLNIIIHTIQKNPQYRDIAMARDNIYGILQNFNHSPLITTCLEGYLDGKLRKGEWEFCLGDSFAAIGAKKISGMDNGAYISYIGYSALLPEKITVDNEGVNFHVAIRYHGFDNRTYVTLGSPLITIDY